MEELFQLILALFVLSFPILSILSRRRQAGRTRRRESGTPRQGRWFRRRRRGAEGAAGSENVAAGAGAGTGEGEPPGAGAEGPQSARRREGPKRGERTQRGAPVGGGGRGPTDGAATAANRPRQAADVPRTSEIGRTSETRRGGPTAASAGQPRQPESAALEYIATRSRLQQAVIWAEVLGRPKALRRTPEPWDDEGSP